MSEGALPKILIVARDAGAANALAPVAHTLLRDRTVAVAVVAFRHAEQVFRHHGLPIWAVDDDAENDGTAAQVLDAEGPDFVLTGTSMKARRDDAFWEGARRRGVPSMAVLDHWSNYWERFSTSTRRRFAHMPDVIAVMDDIATAALVDAGCPSDRVIVTGQPYFDDFDSLSAEEEEQGRVQARWALAASDDAALVVFASEPQAHYYGEDASSPSFLGYTEDVVLQLVLDATRAVSRTRRTPIHVIAKLHPLETPARLRPVAAASRGVSVRLLRHFPPRHLIAAADVVVGMTSVFLLEAGLMGRPSISVQPNRRLPDGYLAHQEGLITRADDADACAASLERALSEPRTARLERRRLGAERGYDGRASARVADEIYRRLGLPAGSGGER